MRISGEFPVNLKSIVQLLEEFDQRSVSISYLARWATKHNSLLEDG
jgi:hypothetical protein